MRYQRLIAACNMMLGRSQMSRRYGYLRKSSLQYLAALRLFDWAIKTVKADNEKPITNEIRNH